MEEVSTVRSNKVYPTISSTWGIVLLLLISSFISGGVLFYFLRDNPSLYAFVTYVIPFGVVSSTLVYFQKHELGESFGSLFKKFDLQIIPFILLFVLGVGYTADFIASLVPMPEYFKHIFEGMIQPTVLSFVTVCIAAPFFEELIFRGILLRSYTKNYPLKKSLIWSSLFFAIVHLNPWQAIPAFILGLFMAWLYTSTRSLIPSIITHFINNLMAFIGILVYGTNASEGLSQGVTWQLSMVISVSGILIAFYSVFRISRILKEKV